MFTGLIADLGKVGALERDDRGATLEIATPLASELSEGDSIAVSGVCLTATDVDVDRGCFSAQAMEETLRRTSLGCLRSGSRVNLELAMRLGDRLGGHIVQGHVDGVGTIAEVRDEGFSKVVSVKVAPELASHLVEKGSVALDGVSLTVSAVGDESFAVSLIPETLSRTTLGRAAVGDAANVEVDVLSKHVERLLATTLTRR